MIGSLVHASVNRSALLCLMAKRTIYRSCKDPLGTKEIQVMKTHLPTPEQREKNHSWYVIDATGGTLGRIASLAAHVLRGKNKPSFTPHLVTGDHVIIVNAGKLKVTGRKLDDKIYYRHTGYAGGIKTDSLRQLLANKPERVLEIAIKGMLPKNSMGNVLLTRLKIYADAEHPHKAQNPKPLKVAGTKE